MDFEVFKVYADCALSVTGSTPASFALILFKPVAVPGPAFK